MPSTPDPVHPRPRVDVSKVDGRDGAASTEARQVRRLALLYVIGGVVALSAAVTLLVEKIALIEDPNYVPSCSINPILSCGSIMSTWQAELVGFPNPVLGIVGFSVVITAGVSLLAGSSLASWYFRGLQVGVSLGMALIVWLVFQSLYVIGALCPYCMVVWAVMWPLFWYTTLFNLRARRVRVPAAVDRVARVAVDFHSAVLLAGYLLVIGLIAKRFWDYWVTLLP